VLRRIPLLVVSVATVTVVIALTGCGGSSGTVSLASFQPSDAKDRAVVWAVGDGPDGNQPARQVGRLVARAKPDRVLYLGDVYEHGTAQEFDTHYANAFGAFAKQTAPTPGNHDWPNHELGYGPYWANVTGRKVPSYYTFKTGGWQLISLNSEMPHGPHSPQLRWLRSQLEAPGDCRIAFWHRPRYSAGDHHGDQPDVQPFWDALAGHAVLALNGHEHDMQRFKPRHGITELVSGAGGHGLYGLNAFYPGLAFGNDSSYGALRLELSRGLARYRFVATNGRTLYSGSTKCRPD
jgi:hypothetical protein